MTVFGHPAPEKFDDVIHIEPPGAARHAVSLAKAKDTQSTLVLLTLPVHGSTLARHTKFSNVAQAAHASSTGLVPANATHQCPSGACAYVTAIKYTRNTARSGKGEAFMRGARRV